jgi:hypothetical protein
LVDIQSGTGTILIHGINSSPSSDNTDESSAISIVANQNHIIKSLNTTSSAITITADASTSPNGRGLDIQNDIDIIASGIGGGITINGYNSDARTWAINLGAGSNVLANGGAINLNAYPDNEGDYGYLHIPGITIGSKASSDITSSSSNITLTADYFDLDGNDPKINTSGNVTIQSYSSAWTTFGDRGTNVRISDFTFNDNSSGGEKIADLTIGKSTNSNKIIVDQSISVLGNVYLLAPADATTSDITLDAAKSITTTGDNKVIVIAAGDDFDNNSGASALVANGTDSRWIVYTADDNTPANFGSLDSNNTAIYGETYATLAPASVATGNRYVFAESATDDILSFVTQDETITYGDSLDLSDNYVLNSTGGVASITNVHDGSSGGNSGTISLTTAYSVTPSISIAATGSTTTNGNDIDAGTYSLTITVSGGTLKSGYSLGSNSNNGNLTVNPADINNASITAIPDQTYTGSTITISPTVTFNGSTVTETTDYTVSFANNTNAGTASLTITGTGNFTASKTVSFTIAKADPSITFNNITKTYGDPDFNLTATSSSTGDISYSILDSSIATVSGTTVTLVGAGTTSITLSQSSDANYEAKTVTTTLTVNAAAAITAAVGTWEPLIKQSTFDPNDDQQSVSDGDLVGNATHAMLETQRSTYSFSSGDNQDEVYYFRVRLGDQHSGGKLGTSFYLALDLDNDLIADVFVEANVKDNTPFVAFHLSDPANAGTGPSNTGWLNSTNNTNIERELTSRDSFIQAYNSTTDLDGNGETDTWVEFAFTEEAIKSFASDALGLSISGDSTLALYTFTSTSQTANGDIGGVNDKTDDLTKSWEELGVIINGSLNDVSTNAILTPTINSETFNTNTVTITGTWGGDKGGTDSLTIELNGSNYNASNGITFNNTQWQLPATLSFGQTYTVTATATRGSESKSATATVTIDQKDLSTASITAIPDQTYTGSAITISPTVTFNGSTVTETTDYTVSFTNNTNAGTASLTITGTGNYSGSKTVSFTIVKADPSITFNDITKTYGDSDFDLTATSSSTGAFTYTIGDANVASVTGSTTTLVGAGTTTVTVTQAADSNYESATATMTLTVNKADPTIIFADVTKTYGAAAFNLTATSSSTGAFSYTISDASVATVTGSTTTIVGAGTTSVTVSQAADDNYNSATATMTLTVSQADITTATVASISDQTYTGSAITISPTVTFNGSTVTETTDYTVSFTNNTNAGTASLTITGTGNSLRQYLLLL